MEVSMSRKLAYLAFFWSVVYSFTDGPTEHAPPPGPPPSRSNAASSSIEYAPPPGAPPGHKKDESYAQPPPADNPPPYHDWTVIPDTSLLPPPPAISYETSPAHNANPDEADRAHMWCRRMPPFTPSVPPPAVQNAVANGDIQLEKPPEFKGDLRQVSRGVTHAKARKGCGDCILLSSLPLYFAKLDSPLQSERRKTVYFEVKVLGLSAGRLDSGDAGIAVGFCARPYPTWRLPGWQRASLGVHGDDGRRFVNDTYGGKDFTSAFRAGETIGIGMTFSVPNGLSNGTFGQKAKADVFFTRNGQREGGWSVDEETDADADSVDGLAGELDLYAGIGLFGAVEFQVNFPREKWAYQA